ncbi:MAG: hypothetical protein CMI52_05045 [Parcubacteria group bacterium]|nr:hypothetical protein [Parcubacteria group bacterium]
MTIYTMITDFIIQATAKALMITTAASTLPVAINSTPSAVQDVSRSFGIGQRVPDPLPISEERGYTTWVGTTAYSSSPDQTDDSPFITANQTVVRDGIVAANFLPFGTRVKVPELYGDKEFVVADRMNARYYKKMDFWMPTREAAMAHGYKYVEIEVLPPAHNIARQ